MKKVKELLDDLLPDIQENQKSNRDKIKEVEIPDIKDKEILEMLLDTKAHYFDEGYYCELTPEELMVEINDCIEYLENVKD